MVRWRVAWKYPDNGIKAIRLHRGFATPTDQGGFGMTTAAVTANLAALCRDNLDQLDRIDGLLARLAPGD